VATLVAMLVAMLVATAEETEAGSQEAAAAVDHPDVTVDLDRPDQGVARHLRPTLTTELPGLAVDQPLRPPLLVARDKDPGVVQLRPDLTTALPLVARASEVPAPEVLAPTTEPLPVGPTSEPPPEPATALQPPTRPAPVTALPILSATTFRATESNFELFDLFSMCQSVFPCCLLYHYSLLLYLLDLACWPCPLYQSNKVI
jgi:hypothetical protein